MWLLRYTECMGNLVERLADMDIDRAAECLTAATGVYVEPFEMPANTADRERCELALAHTARPFDLAEFLKGAKQTRGVLFAVKDDFGALTVHEFNKETSESYRNLMLEQFPAFAFRFSPTIH